jgi:hypothetical protein
MKYDYEGREQEEENMSKMRTQEEKCQEKINRNRDKMVRSNTERGTAEEKERIRQFGEEYIQVQHK